jgi:hypothetical protein
MSAYVGACVTYDGEVEVGHEGGLEVLLREEGALGDLAHQQLHDDHELHHRATEAQRRVLRGLARRLTKATAQKCYVRVSSPMILLAAYNLSSRLGAAYDTHLVELGVGVGVIKLKNVY